jgi:hypothetical protein
MNNSARKQAIPDSSTIASASPLRITIAIIVYRSSTAASPNGPKRSPRYCHPKHTSTAHRQRYPVPRSGISRTHFGQRVRAHDIDNAADSSSATRTFRVLSSAGHAARATSSGSLVNDAFDRTSTHRAFPGVIAHTCRHVVLRERPELLQPEHTALDWKRANRPISRRLPPASAKRR